jgi:uncharacterized protein YycO
VEVKEISLRFATDNDISGHVIKYFSHGDFSHVDIVHEDQLLGARYRGGVAIRPADYKNFTKTKIVTLQVTEEQYDAAWKFLLAQLGKPYDRSAIEGFALNRNWGSTESWFCSELAAAMLIEAKVFPHDLWLSVNKITPSDLLFALSVITDIGRD